MSVATLTDWPWRQWARRCPHAQAIDAGDVTLSWQQLEREIVQHAQGFRQQGVQPENLVILRSANSLQAVVSWLSLLACGARVLALNPRLPDSQLDRLLPNLGADFIVGSAGAGCLHTPALVTLRRAGDFIHPWQPQALATLTLTSGSCGLPKAAAHTIEAHLHSAAAVVALMDFSARDRWLLSLPLFHVSGLGILWRWLLSGATLTLADSGGFSAALARSSFASLVPTQLWRLLRQPERPTMLRSVLLGGAAIAPELVQRAEAAGIRCFCGYGMTESASTVSAKRADQRAGVGKPLDGQEVRIVDGEIWLRSPTLARGYWQQGQLRPLTDADGWLHSGDLGAWRQDELCVLGRRDNLFFCGAEAVQPEVIERLLLRHPRVTQAVVVALADEEYGSRPVALVNAGVALAPLAAWALPQLAAWQRPVKWYTLPALGCGGIKPARRPLMQWVAQQQEIDVVFPPRASYSVMT